jgi:hypothetical protein
VPTYLDAAVVRIQPYLARTPELRLRRGASWMITRATSEQAVDTWIGRAGLSGVARNHEAGHADGVVCLTVPDRQARAVAAGLLLHLRAQIPGADLQASWADTPAYVEFRRVGPRPGDVLQALPAATDFPLARTCGFCRVDPAVQADGACTDCAARDASAGRRRARPGTPTAGADAAETGEEPDALGTERAVLDAVNQRTGQDLRPVKDLSELARLGDPGGNRNHVATVALDGNGMGAFFAALAGQHDTALKQRISPEISAATRSALVDAAASVVRDGDQRLPVVPHVAGGDDVIVTVTAGRAWPFTRAFLSGFSGHLAAAARRLSLPQEIAGQLPTMSAGMIFAHASFPYARAVQLAEDALRRAKRDTRGAEPAIAWLDITVDGEKPPDWRRTAAQAELDRQAADLAALTRISPSGRQVLARLLSADTDEHARVAALAWTRRNGQPVVPRLLNQSTVTGLRNMVALTRWWRS